MRDINIGSDKEHNLIYIPSNLRFRHPYILGRTGAGKSSLMQEMLLQDIKKDYAVVLFDAGDLAQTLCETMPEEILRSGRVIFFSIDHPIPYNPFLRRRNEPERLENELFSLMDQITIQESTTQPLTARMKAVLSPALREVLKDENPTFSTLCNYLIDHEPTLRAMVKQIPAQQFTDSYIGIIDRLKMFVRDPRIRRVLCNPHRLDFDKILDEGKILIVSLAGLEKALVRFLGTLLFQGLESTILERPVHRRKEIAIYVDEFQDYIASHYAVQNFQTIFAQGRRALVSLTVAHQDFGTIDNNLLQTIHGNSAVTISFSCGPSEATQMARVFGSGYKADAVLKLPDYECIARIGNEIHRIKTYPPIKKKRAIQPLKYTVSDPPDPFDLSPRYPEVDNVNIEVHEREPTYKDTTLERLKELRQRLGRGRNNTEQSPKAPRKKTRPRKGV